MKTPVHKLVGYTEDQLQKLIFETMFNWADLYSNNSFSRMQFLLANRQINNWFRVEFKKLIDLFRADLAASELLYKTNTKDRRKLFVTTISKVYDVYPRVLMTEVKASEENIKIKNFSNN